MASLSRVGGVAMSIQGLQTLKALAQTLGHRLLGSAVARKMSSASTAATPDPRILTEPPSVDDMVHGTCLEQNFAYSDDAASWGVNGVELASHATKVQASAVRHPGEREHTVRSAATTFSHEWPFGDGSKGVEYQSGSLHHVRHAGVSAKGGSL